MKAISSIVKLSLTGVLALGMASAKVRAEENGHDAFNCQGLPSHSDLKKALTAARNQANGGFNLDMWGTVVNRDGIVCAVAFTGANRGSEWPGSRVISAQKANTANAFSLPGLVLSTANLYAAVQPGGTLYGLQHSNPVDPKAAYKSPASNFGQANDPLVGSRPGGVNVFGGGLALYAKGKVLLGAIGVSGDTSC
ncbi:MAG: heme-binding protein, partial [Beijerinckiaceae bacterium]|nr:heme-binding protein [Beijerinckiaceae bacterium]